MADRYEVTAEMRSEWEGFAARLPEAVRSIAEGFPPWKLFRMKSSSHRVSVVSYDEEIGGLITLKVAVTGEYNAIMFDRVIFGILPEDLIECDLPDPSETLGTLMSLSEVKENMDALRVAIRPDLWDMSPDGVETRKDS